MILNLFYDGVFVVGETQKKCKGCKEIVFK